MLVGAHAVEAGPGGVEQFVECRVVVLADFFGVGDVEPDRIDKGRVVTLVEVRRQIPIRHQVEHADFHGGVSRRILIMLRRNARLSQHAEHNRDMQSRRCSGNQSLSGSTGIGALFGGADAGGGAAVMTSELTGALVSGVAFGFAAIVSLVGGGATTGAEITVFGAELIAAGGNGFAAV